MEKSLFSLKSAIILTLVLAFVLVESAVAGADLEIWNAFITRRPDDNRYHRGDSVRVMWAVNNLGDETSDSYTVDVYAGDYSIGSASYPGLEPVSTEHFMGSPTCTLPDDIPYGDYTIRIEMSCSNDVNPGNNSVSLDGDIIVAEKLPPDLWLHYVSVQNPDDHICHPGDSINVRCEVENIGDEPSDRFTADVYAGDYHIGSASLRSGMASFGVMGSLPDDIPVGDYSISVEITCSNDSNPDNNSASDPWDITVTPLAPDLWLFYVSVMNRPSDNIFHPGEEIVIHCDIWNVGEVTSASYTVDFYAEDYNIGSVERSPLEADGYDRFNTTWSLPDDPPDGYYTIRAEVTCSNDDDHHGGSNSEWDRAGNIKIAKPVVPDVVGMTQAAAEAAIAAVDSLTSSATTAYSDTVAAGLVISQNPIGGTSVAIGSAVSIVVSLGQPVVPDVVGMTQAAAEAAIAAVDSLTSSATTDYSDTVAAGLVISQNPVGGTLVAIGSTVDVVVSTGPYPVTLDISSGTGGRVITPGEGTFQYDHGQEITLEAEAEPGYHFTNWSGNLYSTDNPVTITMDNDYRIEANFAITQIIIYVDDDAPADPCWYNPAISDPKEDGTAEHPFDMIQEGIDAALDGETVFVRDGTYREAIEFAGRNITVTGFDPNEPNAILPYPVIDANYIGTAVTFCNEEESNCILEGFVITRGAGEVAGGINCMGSSPTISHCLILGNRVMDREVGGGAVFCVDSKAVFENCTFSGNYGGEQGAGLYLCDSNAVLLNCILWDNLPYQIVVACGLDTNITFSDVQDTWPGQGNIDIALFFAELGYWADANNPNTAVEPSEANAVWVGGDYHLKSQAGRWEPYSASWVIDDVTSLCIDAGDPNSDWIAELWSHGKRINMGAYGGTPQASMSLSTVAAPLSKALDTPLSFTTGGSADWFSQTTTFYHDGDAAQSGDISHNRESWIQTTVSGKGTVKFYWKVSSEEDFDCLEFYIDGTLEDQISGSVNWQNKTYTISTSGSHVLEWRYMKDAATSMGDDCGWVDKVEWINTP